MMLLRKFVVVFAKGALAAVLIYVLYILLASTLPYIRQPRVNEDAAARFSSANYFGGEQNGPDQITLIENTTDAYGVRVQMVRSATERIDFVCHGIGEGETTDAFIGELWQAAERGVRIRIILDGKTGIMSGEVSDVMRLLYSHPNVEFRLFNPPSALKPWQWHALLHDKFIAVDNKFVLLGGRNMGDKYFNPKSYTKAVTEDRDVLVWNTEPEQVNNNSATLQVAAYMDMLWNAPETVAPKKMTFESIEKAAAAMAPYTAAAKRLQETNPQYYELSIHDYTARSVPTKKITLLYNPVSSGCKEPWVGYQMHQIAQRAKQSVLLQSPYATAHPLLLDALQGIATKADVVLVTNSIASSPNYPAFSNYASQRQKFVDTGISVYEYQSSNSIHGKSMIVDNHLSVVGSYNMDDRSIYIDTETMLVVDSVEFADVLTGAIGQYKNQSLLVNKNNEYEPNENLQSAPIPFSKKVLMFVVSLFSRPFRFLV